MLEGNVMRFGGTQEVKVEDTQEVKVKKIRKRWTPEERQQVIEELIRTGSFEGIVDKIPGRSEKSLAFGIVDQGILNGVLKMYTELEKVQDKVTPKPKGTKVLNSQERGYLEQTRQKCEEQEKELQSVRNELEAIQQLYGTDGSTIRFMLDHLAYLTEENFRLQRTEVIINLENS